MSILNEADLEKLINGDQEIDYELEDNNAHMQDYEGTLPLDIQEKVLRGEYL